MTSKTSKISSIYRLVLNLKDKKNRYSALLSLSVYYTLNDNNKSQTKTINFNYQNQ